MSMYHSSRLSVETTDMPGGVCWWSYMKIRRGDDGKIEKNVPFASPINTAHSQQLIFQP